MREPKSRQVEHLAVWEWQGDGPLLLMAHATGFHGRCWDRIIRSLPEHWRVIAVDLRGHGASGNPPAPVRWKMFGEDVMMLIDALELHTINGVGHSMGGHSVVHAAALRSCCLTLSFVSTSITASRGWKIISRASGAMTGNRRKRCTSDSGLANLFVPGISRRYTIIASTR